MTRCVELFGFVSQVSVCHRFLRAPDLGPGVKEKTSSAPGTFQQVGYLAIFRL